MIDPDVNLLLGHRHGLLSAAAETDHSLNAMDEMPGVLIQLSLGIIKLHADQHITGKEFPLDRGLFPVFHLGNLLSRNQNLINRQRSILHSDLFFDILADTVFLSGKGVENIPLSCCFVHDAQLCS